jgi:hypothetical protein
MKFRKKPIIVEALEFDGSNKSVSKIIKMGLDSYNYPGDGTLRIATLEGEMTALPGDWIIRGVAGEFYPCKPNIFKETYEMVE